MLQRGQAPLSPHPRRVLRELILSPCITMVNVFADGILECTSCLESPHLLCPLAVPPNPRLQPATSPSPDPRGREGGAAVTLSLPQPAGSAVITPAPRSYGGTGRPRQSPRARGDCQAEGTP